MIRAMAQEGAAGIATAVAESVQYQGRKASRQGSEQRRQDILDAAMRIVVRDGVRAVRHRAVAAEAGVPGMRSSAPGMSPEKIAMADAVMMVAMAAIGESQKVTGTSSAVAMVADSPGSEPTTSP